MRTLREGLKATVERGFVASGLPTIARHRSRFRTLILAYHNVVPDDAAIDGERTLHLPVAAFAAQLDLLRETHDIVPLAAIVDRESASGRRPRAVITFDDAYQGAVTCGVDAVVGRGMPATVFVAPAFLGGRSFWWDAMTVRGTAGPTDDFRREALDAHRGEDAAIRRWAGESALHPRPMPDHGQCASEDELRAAAAKPGITIAPHTWSHRNLCRLASAELEEELVRPSAWLRERFASVLPVVSYPYGLSSPTVERAAAAAGYRAGVRIEGGWVTDRSTNLFALPRLNVPAGVSPRGFVLRTAGLFAT